MSERFYLNWPLAPGAVELTGPEAHHLAAVCRLRAGDEVCLFNGDGKEYPARVAAVAKKSVQVEVLGVAEPRRELDFHLEIATPLPKGDRAQFLVEKLTELGVTTYVPLLCRRSVVHPGEGKKGKLERYVVEASKQCGRNTLLEIGEPAEWASYCVQTKPGELRFVGHPSGVAMPILASEPARSRIRCAAGPEGGFTDEEVGLAIAHGWQAVSLGPRILRIETAALVLATLAVARLAPGTVKLTPPNAPR
jgi:16S rRNA (uracil1498-N3)-methyltransferase